MNRFHLPLLLIVGSLLLGPTSAVAQSGDDVRQLLGQGWTYLEAGNLSKAEQSFQKAFESPVGRNTAEVYYAVAAVWWERRNAMAGYMWLSDAGKAARESFTWDGGPGSEWDQRIEARRRFIEGNFTVIKLRSPKRGKPLPPLADPPPADPLLRDFTDRLASVVDEGVEAKVAVQWVMLPNGTYWVGDELKDLSGGELDPSKAASWELLVDRGKDRKAHADRLAALASGESRARELLGDQVRNEEQARQAEVDRKAEEERRKEEERIAAARAREAREAARLAAEQRRAEDARIAAEQKRADEARRLDEEGKAEAARLERERKESAARLAAEAQKKEDDRKAAERAEAERLAAERDAAERLAAQRAEDERLAAERAEADRLAAVKKQEADRLAAAKKKEADRLAAERRDREAAEQKARAEAERKEAERLAVAERERMNAEERRRDDARIEAEERESVAAAERARVAAEREAARSAEADRKAEARRAREAEQELARADALAAREAKRAEDAARDAERREQEAVEQDRWAEARRRAEQSTAEERVTDGERRDALRTERSSRAAVDGDASETLAARRFYLAFAGGGSSLTRLTADGDTAEADWAAHGELGVALPIPGAPVAMTIGLSYANLPLSGCAHQQTRGNALALHVAPRIPIHIKGDTWLQLRVGGHLGAAATWPSDTVRQACADEGALAEDGGPAYGVRLSSGEQEGRVSFAELGWNGYAMVVGPDLEFGILASPGPAPVFMGAAFFLRHDQVLAAVNDGSYRFRPEGAAGVDLGKVDLSALDGAASMARFQFGARATLLF